MGKKSTRPRDDRRREEPAAGRSFPLFWVSIVVIVLGGVAALALTGRDDATTKLRDRAAKAAPTFADVQTTGTDLPAGPPTSGDDPAAGRPFPTITGTGMDGKPLTISADDAPMVVVGVAHWCPHCQAEVPRIVAWAKANGLPDGVKVFGVSTKVSKSQPNFPPAAWLAEERWRYPTLVDDEVGTAASALGLEGFPHLVFVAADGTVDYRESGEMAIDDFASHLRGLADGG